MNKEKNIKLYFIIVFIAIGIMNQNIIIHKENIKIKINTVPFI